MKSTTQPTRPAPPGPADRTNGARKPATPARRSQAARRRPHTLVWFLLEAGVLLGTWLVVLWATADYLSRPSAPRPSGLYLATTMYLLPIFIAAWMPTRVLPAAKPLLQLDWRMQLAVTPLDPRRYLWRRIRGPFLRSALLLPLAQFTLVAVTERDDVRGTGITPKVVLDFVMILLVFGSMYFIAAAGVFDQLRRQCARGGALSPVGTLVWTLLSFGVPLGSFAGLVALGHFLQASQNTVGASVGLAHAALCLLALVYARVCWLRTCQMFSIFERYPTLRIPGEGAGGWE